MFTGIVQETGAVIEIKKTKKVSTFKVRTKSILKDKKIGQSIAVNGVCVTITNIKDKIFTFDAIPETLELTNLGQVKKNNTINLEPALTLKDGIDGHLVQGHVDTQGTVVSFDQKSDRTILTIKFPQTIAKYLAFKGSITINGVSLTISKLEEKTFQVDLIPHTLEITNLGKLQKEDKINLEVDLIARYLERMLTSKNKESKFEWLKERGFL